MSVGDFTVGQKVRAKEWVYEHADDYAPGGYLCRSGDLLVVRSLREGCAFPILVSHEHVTDRSFGVLPTEIEPEPAATPLPTNPNTEKSNA